MRVRVFNGRRVLLPTASPAAGSAAARGGWVRGVVGLLAGLVLAATSSVALGRGWGDPTGGQPLLQWFVPGDYRTNAWIRSAAEDRDGVLYFASDVLLRYNGTQWETTSLGEGAFIMDLAIDEQSRIWVGGIDTIGYLDRRASGRLEFTSLRSELPAKARQRLHIRTIELTSRGVVFCATDKVIRWDGKSFRIWPMDDCRHILSQQIGDVVYVLRPDSGLWKLEGDEIGLLVPYDPASRNPPCYLVPAGRDAFLAVTAAGLARLEGSKLTLLPSDCDQFIKDNIVTCAAMIDRTTLAIGTFRGGAILIDMEGHILQVVDRAAGLPDQAVNDLLLDREKSLWIMTDNGITRMDSSGTASVFGEQSHLTGKSIRAMAAQNGRLHVVTGDGIFALKPRDAPHLPAMFERLPHSGLRLSNRTLLSLPQGLLTSGSGGARLLQADGTVKDIDRTPLDAASLLLSRHYPGRVYFADQQGVGWFVEADGQWETHLQQASTPSMPLSLAEDASGNLWVSTFSHGVLRIAFGDDGTTPRTTSFEPGKALPIAVESIRLGTLHHQVLLLTGAAVFAHNPVDDTFSPVTVLQELRNAHAISNPDDRGTVWLAAEAPLADGMVRMVVGALALDENLRPTWHPLPIDGLDRIGRPEVLYYQKEATGEPVLWVGGPEGLLRVKLAGLQTLQPPFNALLHSVRAPAANMEADLPLVAAQPPRLPHSRNRIEFGFAATVSRDAQYVRYQTQLAGFEHDWTGPNASSVREFSNLSAGAYTFKVRAVSAEGRWSEPATYRFFILPPWYRTPWAYGLFALVAGTGLYGGYRIRVSQIRMRTRQLESLVRRRTAELARADAAKTDFVASMSHEIRNPLDGVIGLAGLLQESELTPRQRNIAVSLRKCAEYLSVLVEDVLDFSKIEAGQITVEAGPLNLRNVLADVGSVFSWQSQEQRMPVVIRVGAEVPETVIGDETKIKQIVINYVANALKYAGRGTIEIGADSRLAAGGGVEITIEVRDHGPGVPSEEQPEVFEKFNRGRRAQEKRIHGAGLGLAVCRAYAQKMGGVVGLDSTPGQGAIFWLKVPLAVPADQPGTPAVEASPRAKPATRVLIVEDHEYNILVLDSILTRLGYEPDHATDGNDALAMLRQNHYEIVFMDWDLPGMHGVEVARIFRQWEPNGAHALIIATTAYCTPDKRRDCLDAGMDGFVAKPLSPEKIKATIQNLRGRRSRLARLPDAIGAPPAEPASPHPLKNPHLCPWAKVPSGDRCRSLLAGDLHLGIASKLAPTACIDTAESATDAPGAPRSDGPAVRPYHQPDSRDSTGASVSPPLQIHANEEAPNDTLDLAVFRYLSDRQPEKLHEFAEKFIAALDQDVAFLAEAVRSGNAENTRRQAHRVLSQTALISASRVAAVAAAIQEAARKGDTDTPRSALLVFEAEVASLKTALRSALETS
jgi:signal transduction histidine kinase/CheY-like chemotaxis protein/sugar lactone lactonase YvrE/HPt (histidine-containing phosphotransfer) domain-containing protein